MNRRRLVWLAVASALGYPLGYMCAVLAGVHEPLRSLVGLALCFVAALAVSTFASTMSTMAARSMFAFIASPDALVGSVTRDGLSRVDALVMQGKIAEALELIEQRLHDDPADVRIRMRAAELYAGVGTNAERAAALLRGVQRDVRARSAERIQAAYRLMDLYEGPLAMPGRVLVELRWIADTFPDNAAARSAREALGRRKSGEYAT
ncbi:MAG TPA: hypothetical protein VFJ96_02385 [Gemmatimonadaceae bacterium]|nr:hypothetical protein [Gemmatimonadaceae bacterium]